MKQGKNQTPRPSQTNRTTPTAKRQTGFTNRVRLEPLARALEQGPTSVLVMDPRGRIEYVNPRFTEITGYRLDELLGKSIRMLTSDDMPAQVYAQLWRTLRAGCEWRGELHSRKKNGESYWVSIAMKPIVDGHGTTTHYLTLGEDISERKKIQEELTRHAAILHAVNFAAEQFLRAPSWREHMQAVIERLGRATRVSRVYIFENRFDDQHRLCWRQNYEWVADGVVAQIDNPVLQEFEVITQGFARWVALMANGELVKGKVNELPPSEQIELVAEEIKSIVCVPIFVKHVWWGLIGFDDCLTEREWSAAELDALIAAASTLGAAIEREHSDIELLTRANELEAIRQASLSVTSTLHLPTVLKVVCESTLHLIPGVNDVHIFLYANERLEFGASLWVDGKKDVMWSEPRPDGLTYSVARSGQIIAIPNMTADPLFTATPWRGAIIGLPLKIAHRVVGVMTIAFEKPRTFSDAELRALDLLGAQAAIAIENASLYVQVQQLAITDSLTGIYNRRGFFQAGESEIERARRFEHPLSTMMFDLDFFKHINDTYGHPFGDEILVALIAICRKHIRTLDILGRYGGEEFAALLPETDAATAVQIAERVRQVVENTPMPIQDKLISITISIGVATLHDSVFDLAALLDRADRALYRAKQNGRNRVELYNSSL